MDREEIAKNLEGHGMIFFDAKEEELILKRGK